MRRAQRGQVYKASETGQQYTVNTLTLLWVEWVAMNLQNVLCVWRQLMSRSPHRSLGVTRADWWCCRAVMCFIMVVLWSGTKLILIARPAGLPLYHLILELCLLGFGQSVQCSVFIQSGVPAIWCCRALYHVSMQHGLATQQRTSAGWQLNEMRVEQVVSMPYLLNACIKAQGAVVAAQQKRLFGLLQCLS